MSQYHKKRLNPQEVLALNINRQQTQTDAADGRSLISRVLGEGEDDSRSTAKAQRRYERVEMEREKRAVKLTEIHPRE
ncbi:MAG: hypothetical protein J07HQX50_01777 [Haloquadratum sp. J07HQX50]|jgi:hypothetical protein|nr:MAG: hypothetical protein J07HQX50_01777 [Haloquadratum sp. J07HQX50]